MFIYVCARITVKGNEQVVRALLNDPSFLTLKEQNIRLLLLKKSIALQLG